jgi:cytidine deaminase
VQAFDAILVSTREREAGTMTGSLPIKKTPSKLPNALAVELAKITATPIFRGIITAAQAQTLMSKVDITLPRLMLELSSVASQYSAVPVSGNYVGAVACGLSGNLYFGASMEFAGQPLSFCTHAEESATINAWVHGERGLASIAVETAPCGYCRQFLYETSNAAQLSVILPEQTLPLTALLPHAFGPADLGVANAFLSQQDHRLTLTTPSSSPAVLGALAAANMSYAPYTNAFAGVGIVMLDGTVCGAPYAESAARNSSISPIEAALSIMNMWGYSYGLISEVALVQVQGTKVAQHTLTERVLEVIGSPPLTVAYTLAPLPEERTHAVSTRH